MRFFRSVALVAAALSFALTPVAALAQAKSFVPVVPSGGSSTINPVTVPDGGGVQVPFAVLDAVHHRLTVQHAAGVVYLNEFGPAGDGVTDDLPAFKAALASMPAVGGGTLKLNGSKRYLIDSGNLVIPIGVTIQGSADPTDQLAGDYSAVGSAIILNPVYTIVEGKSGLDHVNVISKTLPVIGYSVRAAMTAINNFTGTAITQTAEDAHNRNVLVIGFAVAFQDISAGRPILDHFFFDCTNGIIIDNAHDVPHLTVVHGWPFLTGPVMGDQTVPISGVANNGSGQYRVTTSSAHGMLTGDLISITGVHGAVSANGKWTITYVDATHFDLQNTAPSVGITANLTAGQYGFTVANLFTTHINQSITGSGIPSGSIITDISPGSNTVFMNQAATVTGQVTATVSDSAYTSGGQAILSPLVRNGTALTITNSEGPNMTDFFAFGYETCVHIGTGVPWAQFSGSSCDSEFYDPYSIALLVDSTAYGVKWFGGYISSYGRGLVVNATGQYPSLTMMGTSINLGPDQRTLVDIVKGSAVLVGNDAEGTSVSGNFVPYDIFFNDPSSELYLSSNNFRFVSLRVATPSNRAYVHTDSSNVMLAADYQVTAANVTSCGTGPSVSPNSTKYSGVITEGGGAGGCTVLWPSSYGIAPSCSVSAQDGAAIGFAAGPNALNTSHNAIAANATRTFTYVCGRQ